MSEYLRALYNKFRLYVC